jgi:5'-nucleotidase/UDP-sugar diphosphatase
MRPRASSLARASALLFLPLLLASCAGREAGPRTVTAAPVAPAAVEFTLIGMSDLHGQLEPTLTKLDLDGDGTDEDVEAGGISRLAAMISAIEAERPGRVATVMAGDALMNRYFHMFGGEAIFGLMSDAGYEVYSLGNHEFDRGPEVLAQALASARFHVLCTDLAVGGTVLDGLCTPTYVEDYDGLKVGYFSLMTEELPFVTSAGGIALAASNVDAARRAVDELTREGADLIVGLTHIGEDEDRAVAEAVPGIDVIFGGHSHRYFAAPVRVGQTLIVNGGERGTDLVRLDVSVLPGGAIDFDRTRYELIPVVGPIPAESEVEAKLAGFRESFPEEIVLGRTDVVWDLRSEVMRGGESTVANLVNDLLRTKFRVEIVLNNAGAFRGKKLYQPGPITDVMLSEIDEFENSAYTLDIDGAAILEILERSAACFGQGGLIHASGLRYAIDVRRTAQELAESGTGDWGVAVPGERVTDVQVLSADGTWAPLDPARTYRVLTNSFLVDRAGDGYYWFARHGRNVKNTYSTFRSIMAELAVNTGVLNPGQPDGRLVVAK